MSITYNDLQRTFYPDAIDERSRNVHFEENMNYEDRTGAEQNLNKYYVLADDVNALQESIISIERSLGIRPQGVDGATDLSRRLNNLEAFVTMPISNIQGFVNLDERYMWGGQRPSGLPSNSLISIKYHVHSGTASGADRIDLTSHVTGILRKGNLNLTERNSHTLTSQDILVSTSGGTTISESLDSKLDESGGIITGDLHIQGGFRSRTSIEIDAKDTLFQSNVGSNQIDAASDSGMCRLALGNLAGQLCRTSVDLRYGHYCMAVRMRVVSNASPANVCRVYARDTSSISGVTEMFVKPNMFASPNIYQTVFLEFTHRNHTSSMSRPLLEIGIDFLTGSTAISIDSIVISPIHTAVYDDII